MFGFFGRLYEQNTRSAALAVGRWRWRGQNTWGRFDFRRLIDPTQDLLGPSVVGRKAL